MNVASFMMNNGSNHYGVALNNQHHHHNNHHQEDEDETNNHLSTTTSESAASSSQSCNEDEVESNVINNQSLTGGLDGDDEHGENYDDEDVEEEEDTHEHPENDENESLKLAKANELYRKNCLAAAQMMQLMCSTATSSSLASSSSSNSSSCVEINSSSNEASPNNANTNLNENEKENNNVPVCKYCQKVFANFSNLNHHVSAIHLQQSKWVCSQCGKICSSKSNLKVHLRVHLRVKPYHCRWCSYACMHHSSIRDHLAKVHPDQTHTPLQPGYLFNSQAVPEPEVFNAKGFSVNTFVTDSRKRASNEQSSDLKTSPKFKKTRISASENIVERNKKETNQQSSESSRPSTPPISSIIPPSNTHINNNTGQFNANNLYNAYTMARMFPFMYHQNPMQPSQSSASPHPSFFGILNQNLLSQYNNMQQQHQSRSLYPSFNAQEQHLNQSNNMFSNMFSNHHNSINSTDDHHHPANSCSSSSSSANLSYSTSSRSSSLSPGVTSLNKEDIGQRVKEEPIVKILTPQPKKSFNIDQMLSTSSTNVKSSAKKATREIETQTDSSCLNCPVCSNKCV